MASYKKTCKKITKKVTKFERKHPVFTGTCYIASSISIPAIIVAYPINRIRINRALKAMGEQENIDQNAQQPENAANAATDNNG